ncbi:DUF1176 domain-containing protein [Luteimonas sp. BDR2-5]|uniref:DUF1176 domain-containing protein n=1 Tax=Proluteimonas luteida TaxID=2878685 RepID=UPI001E31B43D|nr:DUF1176 domain-containing protein [Luteimonas sp. BDR2-5]MCD9027206.1 DUF1176 domain-containing protein [Luteimonas sp. BDR2-5]
MRPDRCHWILTAIALPLLAACAADAPGDNAGVPQPAGSAASAAAVAMDGDTGAAGSADAPAHAAGAMPVYLEFRDFTVACDNGLRCEAVGVADDGGFGLVLGLSREAGADGAQQLRLSAAEKALDAAGLRIDDRPAKALSTLPWQGDGEGELSLDGTAVADFIDIVRNGARLSAGEGDAAVSLSLSGLSAALLRIDEQQGRLDTRGAWLRRGTRDDAAATPAPTLPLLVEAAAPPTLAEADGTRLAQQLRAEQAEALRSADCDAPRDGFDLATQDTAAALDADHALVFLACLGGAYQTSSLVFRVGRAGEDATRVVPPVPATLAGVVPGDFALLTNAGYDADTATLSHFAKGRGLGDCGESAQWRYDGREFQLAGYAAMRRCGGASPGDWPSLWRSDVVR